MLKHRYRRSASLLARMIVISITGVVAFGLLTTARAEDWPQFRGPNGSGVSVAANRLPEEFGPEKNMIWKTALPPGHSSPVLTKNRIFVTAYSKVDSKQQTADSKQPAANGQEKANSKDEATEREKEKNNYKLLVICLDRQTGKLLWQREVPRSTAGRLQYVNGPASPSPVTDGSNVYAFFQEFGLVSYDEAGKQRWQYPLGPFNIFFGFGASPILVDDKVILPVDQDSPSPTFRLSHGAVWTGKEMIVWGGHCISACYRNDGAAYDPLADAWRPIKTPSFLAVRKEHTAFWTGTHMLIWGGNNAQRAMNDGGLYDPEKDEWKQITLTDAPVARILYSAVWTGTEMIVWGGQFSRPDGKIYDPVSDRWRPMSTYGLALNVKKQPLGKERHSAVWTGEEMIVWGGGGSTPFRGYRYNPRIDQWLPITNENAPVNRVDHTAVWADGAMMIWAGIGQRSNPFDGPYAGATGGVYRPGCGVYVTAPRAGERVNREVTFELATGTATGAPQQAQLVVDGTPHGEWTPVEADGRVKLKLSDELKGAHKWQVRPIAPAARAVVKVAAAVVAAAANA